MKRRVHAPFASCLPPPLPAPALVPSLETSLTVPSVVYNFVETQARRHATFSPAQFDACDHNCMAIVHSQDKTFNDYSEVMAEGRGALDLNVGVEACVVGSKRVHSPLLSVVS